MDNKEQLIGIIKNLSGAFKEKSPIGEDLNTMAVTLQQLSPEAFSAHVDEAGIQGVIDQITGSESAPEITPEAPVDDIVSEAPVDEAPVDEAPVDEAPVDEEVPAGDENPEDETKLATPEEEPSEEEKNTEEEEEDDMDKSLDLPTSKEANEIFKKYASGNAGWNRGATDVVLKAMFPAHASFNKAPGSPSSLPAANLPVEQMPTELNVNDNGIVEAAAGAVQGISKAANMNETEEMSGANFDGKSATVDPEEDEAAGDNHEFGSGFKAATYEPGEKEAIASLFN